MKSDKIVTMILVIFIALFSFNLFAQDRTVGQDVQENSSSKIKRYAPDYSGFDDVELIPEDFIELPAENFENLDYPIVDTNQSEFFNNDETINAPQVGEDFYGQDAQYDGNQPSFTDNQDGTITDNVTGLMWTKTCDLNGDGAINYDDKLTYGEAIASANSVDIGGYDDWRLPNIKEQYSLIQFSGIDCSNYQGTNTNELTPFIDRDYFDFDYGDTSVGERIIDSQMATTTLYVSTTMNGDETMFGVNFADGRIKGYPSGQLANGDYKRFYVYYVRDSESYGVNNFENNNDDTITDNATGLMWAKNDSEEGLNWEEALNWTQQKNSENYLGYNDWRLPNIKELQSIIDYTRSPETSNSAALDPVFNISSYQNENNETDYPYFWSSTTHENTLSGNYASYVSFGRALGWMEQPANSGNYTLMDVHGAGSQRSDIKYGNPENWPYGHGPQGDVVRIYNYVRLVRDSELITEVNEEEFGSSTNPAIMKSIRNYPNPFNPETTISFSLNHDNTNNIKLKIFNVKGQQIRQYSILNNQSSIIWDGTDSNNNPVSSGIYFYKLSADNKTEVVKRCLLLK